MDLELSSKRYHLDIPQCLWLDFFTQLTDENRGRFITLKLLDGQLGDFDLLHHKPLFSVIYDRPNYGNDLVVTVSRSLGVHEATYAHRIVYPQAVDVVTNNDGVILSFTVTDDDHAQTVISFQS
ncbi:DUF5335 family protein [Nodosilinea sp. LEGE 07298]|uniref:DUF5335 family protein n=1 Tax=Nodosilinea sp. LEGE 07298 TaxID=2777970 RepID=UPI0018807AC3|nr:DUF5335 family protein [Nodosilinea sp. LEGE 07298]MBE9113326.1 DUF5335 family protein [Nodosilinea sp. LEGE 07298]